MRFLQLCTIVLALFLLLNLAAALSPGEEKEIYKSLAKEGKARIIVNFADHSVDGPALETGKYYLASKEIVNENRVILEVNSLELEQLLNDPSVNSINYDYPVYAALQDSARLVNATLTWPTQIYGMNLTGANQTICIIDTGINYSNSNLGGCFGNNNASSSCKVLGGYDFVNDDNNPMDDEGHGTHVAGITAAKGNITGIAPDAKLIAIKSLDSNGEGFLSDVTAGISWCVGNATRYNISVISMSLATITLYSSYCDADFSDFSSSINAAVAQNISIIAATGNEGNGVSRNTTAISSPACIQNVTPISATNKDDSIASYAHYSSIVQLFAPGTVINSTSVGGTYGTSSGTSMAAPHAAAAFAIIRQFLSITRQSKTPQEIENILNSTGKIISDGSSNFSRINIYAAISLLQAPNVTLISPSDSLRTKNNQTFSCNATTPTNFTNITFFLWNSTSLVNQSYKVTSGTTNGSTFFYNFSYEESYAWNCQFGNLLGSVSQATRNYTVIYDTTSPLVNILSPSNQSYLNAARMNISLNENGTCIASLNGGISNVSMNTSDQKNFSYVNSTLNQGDYANVNYYCNDSAGNINYTQQSSFFVDLTSPNVTTYNPEESFSTTGTSDISFYYNVADNLNLSFCSLYLNGALTSSNSSFLNQSTNHTIIYSVSPGSYSWNINCSDSAGNVGNSSTRSMIINQPASVSSSGGGGGGGGGGGASGTASVYIPNEEQLREGYTKIVKKADKIQINFFDGLTQKHTITVDEIREEAINITLRSDPLNFLLDVGQSIKLNLSSSENYDVLIRLDSISGQQAVLTVQIISDPIYLAYRINEDAVTSNYTNESLDRVPAPIKIPYTHYIIGILIIIILFIIGKGIMKHYRAKQMHREIVHDIDRDYLKKLIEKHGNKHKHHS